MPGRFGKHTFHRVSGRDMIAQGERAAITMNRYVETLKAEGHVVDGEMVFPIELCIFCNLYPVKTNSDYCSDACAILASEG